MGKLDVGFRILTRSWDHLNHHAIYRYKNPVLTLLTTQFDARKLCSLNNPLGKQHKTPKIFSAKCYVRVRVHYIPGGHGCESIRRPNQTLIQLKADQYPVQLWILSLTIPPDNASKAYLKSVIFTNSSKCCLWNYLALQGLARGWQRPSHKRFMSSIFQTAEGFQLLKLSLKSQRSKTDWWGKMESEQNK